MKYILLISILLSIAGAGVKLVYDKFDSLQSELLSLRTTNKVLTKKNSVLKDKQRTTRKKIKDRKTMLINKKLKRAKYKIAKAPVSMVPIAGAAVVVGMTAYDIRTFCEDIKEYKSFEESILGSMNDEVTENEKLLCGLNVEDTLMPELDKYKNISIEWISENYNVLIHDMENQYRLLLED